jgi:hypothetical protein
MDCQAGAGQTPGLMATVTTKRGKKPRPPGHVKVYKTAVFKIHNPSQHKRAMLKDSMKRAHLAYTRLLAHFLAMSAKEGPLAGVTRRLGAGRIF